MPQHIVLEGLSVGTCKGLADEFDATFDFSYCKLCGWVYQDKATRLANTPFLAQAAAAHRAEVANNHYLLAHSEEQRRVYETQAALPGGLFLYPEAAIKLAAVGVIAYTDLLRNTESQAAYAESNPIPLDKDIHGR